MKQPHSNYMIGELIKMGRCDDAQAKTDENVVFFDKKHQDIRFLSPAEGGTVLTAGIGNAVSRPFKIDLYVRFPESDEPQLFNIRVPAASQ